MQRENIPDTLVHSVGWKVANLILGESQAQSPASKHYIILECIARNDSPHIQALRLQEHGALKCTCRRLYTGFLALQLLPSRFQVGQASPTTHGLRIAIPSTSIYKVPYLFYGGAWCAPGMRLSEALLSQNNLDIMPKSDLSAPV